MTQETQQSSFRLQQTHQGGANYNYYSLPIASTVWIPVKIDINCSTIIRISANPPFNYPVSSFERLTLLISTSLHTICPSLCTPKDCSCSESTWAVNKSTPSFIWSRTASLHQREACMAQRQSARSFAAYVACVPAVSPCT